MSQSTGKVLLAILHTLLHRVHLCQGKIDRTYTARWLLQAESIKSHWTSLCLPSQIPYWSVLYYVPWDWLVRDGNSFPLMYGEGEQCEASYRHYRFDFLCLPFYTKTSSQKMWQKAVVYFTLVGMHPSSQSSSCAQFSVHTKKLFSVGTLPKSTNVTQPRYHGLHAMKVHSGQHIPCAFQSIL